MGSARVAKQLTEQDKHAAACAEQAAVQNKAKGARNRLASQ